MLRIIGLTGFICLAELLEAAPLAGRLAASDGGHAYALQTAQILRRD